MTGGFTADWKFSNAANETGMNSERRNNSMGNGYDEKLLQREN